MKTGTAYRLSSHVYGKVEMLHKWKRVEFVGDAYRGRVVFVRWATSAVEALKMAYAYLNEQFSNGETLKGLRR